MADRLTRTRRPARGTRAGHYQHTTQEKPVLGRMYLLAGVPVTIAVAYNARRRDLPPCPPWLHWEKPPKGTPRNVAVRFPDGTAVVRGFRGLRTPPAVLVQGALF